MNRHVHDNRLSDLPSQKNPRRSRAPVPLLVPCFLAHTRPLLCPRRSMRRSTSEPAVPVSQARPALPPAYALAGVASGTAEPRTDDDRGDDCEQDSKPEQYFLGGIFLSGVALRLTHQNSPKPYLIGCAVPSTRTFLPPAVSAATPRSRPNRPYRAWRPPAWWPGSARQGRGASQAPGWSGRCRDRGT